MSRILLLESDVMVARASLRRLRQLCVDAVLATSLAAVEELAADTYTELAGAILETEIDGRQVGVEAAAALRARFPGLPVVFWSTAWKAEDLARARQIGPVVEKGGAIDEPLARLAQLRDEEERATRR